ncbi:MAG TPA: sulfatase-like hydrolase/transferase [Candidatus Acidoferrum sp.]|nr:sulfatase-like hydrolase/transferase [Candidatus Acidoferrum sp.]
MKRICFHPASRAAAALFAIAALGPLATARADLSALFTNAAQSATLPRRPSIVLIMAEGLGCGDLSCYGQTNFQTPNLDRLAAGGVRFTSYYAGSAASSPARAALLLGREPGRLRQRADADVPLAADETTLAQVLNAAGYHTGLIGEWNLGDDRTAGAPWLKGFDEFAGYFDPADAKNSYADYMWRYAPRSLINPTNSQREDFVGREMLYPNTGGKKGQYIPDLYALATMNFISINQPDPFNRYRPFFLLVNYPIPGSGRGEVPSDAPYSDEPWPPAAKNRAAMISRLDGYVGQLLEQLRKPGLSNSTVVFFTSDAGPQADGNAAAKFFLSAGPFRGGRDTPYEGGLRVPMIAYGPGKISAGRVSDFAWAAWDFLPTVLDLARVFSPTNIDGLSLWPALQGQTQTNRHEVFHWQLRGRNTWHTVRLDDWEAVQPTADAPLELYNLKTDPGETNNVAGQNPDVVSRLQSFLKGDR